ASHHTASQKQELVRDLASEKGLEVIKNIMVGAFITASQSFNSLAHPFYTGFLQLIAHRYVVSSLILEKAVGTIYNIVYGPNGTRAITFFDNLLSCFELETPQPVMRKTAFDSMSRFLLSIIIFNKDTMVQPKFIEFFKRIKECCSDKGVYRDALENLQEIEERLSLGSNCETIKSAESKKVQCNASGSKRQA